MDVQNRTLLRAHGDAINNNPGAVVPGKPGDKVIAVLDASSLVFPLPSVSTALFTLLSLWLYLPLCNSLRAGVVPQSQPWPEISHRTDMHHTHVYRSDDGDHAVFISTFVCNCFYFDYDSCLLPPSDQSIFWGSHSISSGKPPFLTVLPHLCFLSSPVLTLACILYPVPRVGSCSPRIGTVLPHFPVSPTARSSTGLATSRPSGNTYRCPVPQSSDHSLGPAQT